MTDAQQIAEIQRLGREVAKLSGRVAALEQQGSPVQLAKIAELLEPVSKHSANILAVQSGALGVRP